jgi:hypothetical protein
LTKLVAKLNRGGNSTDQYQLAYAKYFLALTRFDMGHKFQAQRLLDEANRAATDVPRSSTSIWYWWRPVVLDTLRREVEGRLNNERANLHPAAGRR